MKVRFTTLAEHDARVAKEWYDSKAEGLGDRFLAELGVAIENLEQFPRAWHPLGDGVRRYSLERFPYGVSYMVVMDECIVFAIDHLKRRPRHWKDRLKALKPE